MEGRGHLPSFLPDSAMDLQMLPGMVIPLNLTRYTSTSLHTSPLSIPPLTLPLVTLLPFLFFFPALLFDSLSHILTLELCIRRHSIPVGGRSILHWARTVLGVGRKWRRYLHCGCESSRFVILSFLILFIHLVSPHSPFYLLKE